MPENKRRIIYVDASGTEEKKTKISNQTKQLALKNTQINQFKQSKK